MRPQLHEAVWSLYAIMDKGERRVGVWDFKEIGNLQVAEEEENKGGSQILAGQRRNSGAREHLATRPVPGACLSNGIRWIC